jgi:predicted metal-dependent phosphoesterase TrpH
MTSDLRIDLHLHSTASDGTVSPAEVVRHALEGGLTHIALTDHDTAAGVQEAREAARGTGLEVVAGIEVSATWEEGEVHILGYGIDPNHPGILHHGSHAATRREDRMLGMVERLQAQGLPITLEAVEAEAGPDRESLARPHLARALVTAGVVEHAWEAFDRYIGDEHPAFVPTNLVTLEEALALIHEAGGISSWAHPPEAWMDTLLPRMRRAGLQGLEVHRPRTPQERRGRLLRRARSAGLLPTGGSDWHGPEAWVLGEFALGREELSGLLEALEKGAVEPLDPGAGAA